MTRAFRRGALLGSISAIAMAGAALAAASTDQTKPEEVVVTATKRAEILRNVPMAVTALTGDQLMKQQAFSFADFISRVPGMTYSSAEPGHTDLILRGINAGGVGSTVGTYLDETPYGSSSALANGSITTPNLDTFDIARVEVLRGPQGTLYGSSTLGGLLKFVTNAPDPSGFDDAFQVGLNSVDHGDAGYLAKGMINIPLGDALAFRAVGYEDLDGGFIDDPVLHESDVNKVHNYGGRASLLWTGLPNLSVRLTGLMQKIDVASDFAVDMLPGDSSGTLTFKPLFGDLEHGRFANEYSNVQYKLGNATANYDFGWASLVSSTSFGTFDDHILTDGTNPTLLIGIPVYVQQHLAQKKFTQEVRLESPGGGNFDWLGGLYYTHETADLLQPILLTPHLSSELGAVQLTSSYAETAGFANFTYHFLPEFDVSAGGRFSHNSQSANEFIFGALAATGGSSGNVFTWSLSPEWHPNENTMVYGRVAKGFRPGGPNALPPGLTDVPTSYAADSLINYEAGVKGDYLDGKLSLDADVYYIDWSQIQLLEVVNGFGVNGNGGSATSKGFEWSATWLPIDNLSLTFGGAFTDANLTQDAPAVGALSGDWLPYVPRWSTTFDADYTFDAIGDFRPFVGMSWQYIGERFSGFGSTGQAKLPSYNNVDLRAGVDFQNNWSIELYVKNLGDSRGITAVGGSASQAPVDAAAARGIILDPGATPPTVAVIRPRLIGITLSGKI